MNKHNAVLGIWDLERAGAKFHLRRTIDLLAGRLQKPANGRFVLMYTTIGNEPIIDSCQTESELHAKADLIARDFVKRGFSVEFQYQLGPGVLGRLTDPKRVPAETINPDRD
jgi:hypothetical protein